MSRTLADCNFPALERLLLYAPVVAPQLRQFEEDPGYMEKSLIAVQDVSEKPDSSS